MTLTGRLRRNIFALSILQVMNYAAPLVTVPYLSRVLGPERFGLLALAQAVIVYFDLITDYGFNFSATRQIANHREDRAALSRVFWSTLVAKTALMLVCALVLSVLLQVVPGLHRHALLYAAAFLTVVGSALFPVWLFQGLEQMKYLTMGLALARLGSIPALILLVKRSDDYVRAAAIQGAVPIIAALIAMPIVWKHIGIQAYRPTRSEIVASLKEGRHLFLSNTAMYLFGSTTVLLLGWVAGNTQVGYYSAADKLIKAASSLVNPVTQALFPHLNSLRTISDSVAIKVIRKSLVWVGSMALAASVGTFVIAAPLGHTLLGPEFGPSVSVLRVMAPLLLILALNNILGTQTMVVFGLDALVSRIALRCVIANAVLTMVLAGSWGARGAAAATVMSSLCMAAQMAGALRKANLAVWRSPKSAEAAC
jgi:PST family polysaccharide transporter